MPLSPDHPLSRIVAAHGEGARDGGLASPELEPILTELWSSARAGWPELSIPPAVFLPYLIDRVPHGPSFEAALRAARASDLYLACACMEGDSRAIALFDRAYLSEVDRALARIRPGDSPEDLKQLIREKLLVGEPGSPPKIGHYSGRGDLRGWVRVIVTRLLVDLVRERKAQKREQRPDLLEREAERANPENEYLKKHYRVEFAAAFQQAIASLSPRQRNLLRQQVVHDLTLDEIAGIYRVHRATIARWLSEARDLLLAETHRQLMAKLRVSPSEFDSIMRLIHSELDFSVRRMLGPDEPSSTGD